MHSHKEKNTNFAKDTKEIESILQNERSRHEKATYCINTPYSILEMKTMNSLRKKIRS